jgi:ABC-2 type transport system permease protein
MDAPLATPPPAAMPAARVLGAYLAEARCECLRYLRAPSFMGPVLLFPGMFYLLFGVFLGHANGPDAPRYLLASYTVFGVMAPGLYGFGVSLAMERGTHLLMLKRAQPMPALAYLVGKLAMAVLVAAVVSLLLIAMSIVLAHAGLHPAQMLALFAVGTLGVIPFAALGMLVGSLVRGQGGPGLINLIYLPMAFLSGLWFPLSIMPAFFQKVAPLWPSWQLNQLALAAVGLGRSAAGGHVLALLGFTAAFLGVAARRLRRYG